MITRQTVSDKILSYLNNQINLAQLVEWAEMCMVEGGFDPEADIDLLVDVVMYLAGADTDLFPLTWDICQDFMTRLGTPIRVVPM
jgi:hypothetical protein